MQIYTEKDFDEIVFELRNENAIILPTDTVYGVISLKDSIIYKIKKRSYHKKLITFVGSIDYIPGLNKNERKVLEKYWPGKLTIIKNKKSYRMPNDQLILKLLDEVGYLFSSSANVSGKSPIQSVEEAKEMFPKKLDLFSCVKSSCIPSNKPSTIINFDTKKVIREGEISGQEILKLL